MDYFPICDGHNPNKLGSDLNDSSRWMILAEIATVEGQLGHLQEAIRYRQRVRDSEQCPEWLRWAVLEELVRDHFCLGQTDLALDAASELPEPVRGLYRTAVSGGPPCQEPELPEAHYHHRLFYRALGHSEHGERRRRLSRFLTAQCRVEARPWEVEEARHLATQLCRRIGQPFCLTCCGTAEDGVVLFDVLGQGRMCGSCATHSASAMLLGLHPIAPKGIDTMKLYKMLLALEHSGFREEFAGPGLGVRRVIDWSDEGLRCLARAEQGHPPPWGTADLLNAICAESPAERKLLGPKASGFLGLSAGAASEEVSADGKYTVAWHKALELACWLRFWDTKPGKVLPLDLLRGLFWSEGGVAASVLLASSPPREVHELWTVSERLTLAEIRRLENQSRERPEDTFLHCLLLQCHFCSKKRSSRISNELFHRHAQWLVEHRPYHPQTLLAAWLYYSESGWTSRRRDALLRKTLLSRLEQQTDNRQDLRLAAQAYQFEHQRIREFLLARSKFGAAPDPRHFQKMSEACAFRAQFEPAREERRNAWQQSLLYAKKCMLALDPARPQCRPSALETLLPPLLHLELWLEAQSVIEELVALGRGKRAIVLLGSALVALARGQLEEAEISMLQVRKDKMAVAGLDSILIHRLLLINRREVVIKYLARSRMPGSYQDKWLRQIRSGETPDFMAYVG